MTVTIERSADHKYTVDGVAYDGVTTVIGRVIRKPQLERWIGDLGNVEAARIRDEAGDHGTLVHSLAALRAAGVPSIPMDDEGATGKQLADFAEWYDANVDECYGVEVFVCHPTYRYAGALDLAVRLKGDKVTTILDIKSGRNVYPEMRYQSAAYREAAILSAVDFMFRGCRRGLLHLPAEGKPRFYEHTRHQADFQGFASCLYLYRDLQRGL